MIELTQKGDDVLLPVKAVPNASRTKLVGEWDGHLKITVAAPPEKGKANKAIIELLAKTLGLPKNRIALESAPANPRKIFRITGIALRVVQDRISPAASGS